MAETLPALPLAKRTSATWLAGFGSPSSAVVSSAVTSTMSLAHQVARQVDGVAAAAEHRVDGGAPSRPVAPG